MKSTAHLQALLRFARMWTGLGSVALAFVGSPAGAAVTEAWVQRYNGPAASAFRLNEPHAVAVDASGNVVVTGSSYGTNSNSDCYTAKYAAATGALLWERRYNGAANGHDNARALAVDSNGNVVVTGGSFNGINQDYYTAKYAAADGALLWEKRYNGPANYNDGATAVAVDSSGNVVVTGSSVGGETGDNYYTAKYAAADGALIWEQSYSAPGNTADWATAVAVDGDGDVIVTGSSNGGSPSSGGTSWDYYTAKYASADGALIWEQSYNGPGNTADWATAMAVDGRGNVVVTGYSASSGGANDDYATVKYAAADGTLLWERRYDGPANGRDDALAVAVDSTGNVAVTGFSIGSGGNFDSYTAKYAAADGTLLWERRYNSPWNGDDSSSAVAVDEHGNVVVTGSSNAGATDFARDFYTARYAAADGALLWERRYNGPANGVDTIVEPCQMALGPNGMVAVTGASDGSSGYSDFATVVYWESLPTVAMAMDPAGVRLRFPGVPDHSYSIERAPSVTGPWITIATSATPLDGAIDFVDTNAPAGQAFYRTRLP